MTSTPTPSKTRSRGPRRFGLPRSSVRPAILLAILLGAVSAVAAAQPGTLGPGDDTLQTGEYFDLHTREGRSGERWTLTLRSDAFDPYLMLIGPDDAVLLQVDDSDGYGLDAHGELALPADGAYTVVVTSALAGETGDYLLTVQSDEAAAPAANPLGGPAANPLGAPGAAPAAPFAGVFGDGTLTVRLQPEGEGYRGTIARGADAYPAEGQIVDGALEGSFEATGTRFPFTATVDGDALQLTTGGAVYRLPRRADAAPTNPLAGPAGHNPVPAQPSTPTAAPAAPVVPERSLAQARPGFVVGSAFDTLGRPLAGAGVLIHGTTFAQGQRTTFEAVTGPDGTYAVRVPDGRYSAKAWIDVDFLGHRFSRLLHPLSGSYETEVDSTEGGTLDFQWRLSGLAADSAPSSTDPTDFYGASIELSYCGLPADAYCDFRYEAFPERPIAPEGSTVTVTLTPTGPRLDGSAGELIARSFAVQPQDPEYPYGGAPNAPAGFEAGGGGRTTLGRDWQYHSVDLNDIPVGSYELTATATFPDGTQQPLRVGLAADDVEHLAVPVTFTPWEGYQARSYIGGGLDQLTVYVRD